MLPRRQLSIVIGCVSALALVACEGQMPTQMQAPRTPRTRVLGSVVGTRVGNAIDLGNLGFPAAQAPVIADNGDITGAMQIDAADDRDGVFWSPATGLTDMGVPTNPLACEISWANGLNASDQVVGFANCSPAAQSIVAFRWTPSGGFQILVPPPSAFTLPYAVGIAINKDGVVAGAVDAGSSPFPQVARWDAGGAVEVAPFDATCVDASMTEINAPALVINDAGDIAGEVFCQNATGFRGFFWAPGSTPQVIGTLGGDYTRVVGINANGTVVGYSATADGAEHPFRWTQTGGLQDLGTLNGSRRADPVGVADDESVAGWYEGAAIQTTRSWRWTPSTGMQDLGLLPNANAEFLDAQGISRNGIITGSGSAADNGPHAFRWSTTHGLEDLGTLGGIGTVGESVNSAGQVAGFYFRSDGSVDWVRFDGLSSTSAQTATITLSNLEQVYDGAPKLATVTTSPADLSGLTISYSQAGAPVASPINAGSYDVVATLTNPSFTATPATGTLVISRAAQRIVFPVIPNHTLGDPAFTVSATGGASGNPVVFSSETPTVCTVSGTTVTLVAVGMCIVDASQAGTTNYDPAANVADNFNVIFPFSGFLPPLGGTTANLAKAGAGVAINFSLAGNRGLNVLAYGSPNSAPSSCSTHAQRGPAVPTQSAGNVGLQYDPTTEQYTYVWKTDRSWRGTCRTLFLQLSDATTYRVAFQFR